jgi:hypothetical protein
MDVPADAMAVTRPQQIVRPGHAQTLRARFSARKAQGSK